MTMQYIRELAEYNEKRQGSGDFWKVRWITQRPSDAGEESP